MTVKRTKARLWYIKIDIGVRIDLFEEMGGLVIGGSDERCGQNTSVNSCILKASSGNAQICRDKLQLEHIGMTF